MAYGKVKIVRNFIVSASQSEGTSLLTLTTIMVLLFMPFARLGVDSHHDGLMVSVARGVSEGRSIHQEVFTIYGPIISWIQALEFRLGGGTLVSIRVGSVLAISAAVAFMWRTWSEFFGSVVATVSVVAWLCATPFFSSALSMIPWNSDYVMLVQSLILYQVARRRKTAESTRWFTRFHLIGILLGLVLFLRISVGVVTFGVVVLLLVLGREYRVLRQVVIGACVLEGVILGFLLLQGSLGDWWYQYVEVPRLEFVGNRGTSGFESLRASIITLGLPGLAILFYAREAVHLFQNQLPSNSFIWRLSAIGALSVGAVLILRQGIGGLWSPERALWAFILVSPIGVLGLSRLGRDDRQEAQWHVRMIILFGITIGSLTQLFPLTDLRHVWWSAFPAMGPAIHWLISRANSKGTRVLLAGLALGPLIWNAASVASNNLRIERVSLESPPVLRGMLVSKEFAQAFDGYFAAVDEFERKLGPKPVLNICFDGLFASIGKDFEIAGNQVSYDPQTIDMNVKRTFAQYIKEREPIIWFCPPTVAAGNSPSSPNVQTLIPSNYRFVERSICLQGVGGYDDWPLMSYLAVPKVWGSVPIERVLSDFSTCSNL